jgi:hypothetical protein
MKIITKPVTPRLPVNDAEFKISVTVEYAEYDGINSWYSIDKSLVLPAARQPLPVFIFGNYEFPAYNIGAKIFSQYGYNSLYPFFPSGLDPAPINGWFFDGVNIYGYDQQPYWQFPTRNAVLPDNLTKPCVKPSIGDIIFRWFSGTGGKFYKAFVIVHTDNSGYNAIREEISRTPIKTHSIVYLTDNPLQFNNPIHLVTYDKWSKYKDNQYYPNIDKPPLTTANNTVIVLKIKQQFDHYSGFYYQHEYNTNILNFIFKFSY